MGNNIVSKLTKQVLIELYVNQGKTQTEIGVIFKCSGPTVKKYLCKHNIKIRTTSESKRYKMNKNLPSIDTLISEYKNCQNASNLAKKYGCSPKVVISRLNDAGVRRNKGGIYTSGSLLGSIRHSAKVRGLEFNITPHYIDDIYIRQNNRCVFSGETIKLQFGSLMNNTASVDRIINSIGYTSGNIWLTHKDINIMRMDLTIKHFIDLCALVDTPFVNNVNCSSCIITKKGNAFNGYGNISLTLWNRIKYHCGRSREIDLDMTITDAWNLFLKQRGYCSLTGRALEWGYYNKRGVCRGRTASLDRIDSNKNYTISNVQWVHKDINQMKWDLPQDKFIHWCRLVIANVSTPEWQDKYGHYMV